MKNSIFLLVVFCFASLAMQAQVQSTQAEKEREEEGIVEEEVKPRDRLIMTLSFENLFHKETNGFKSLWHSRGIGFYFMYDMPIKNSPVVSFAPGIGIQYSNYYHNSFVVEDSMGTRFDPITDFREDDNYKRHKLAVTHLEIPLELRFFSQKSDFKAALGFKAGLRIAAHTKEVRLDDEVGYFKRFKEKSYQDISIVRAGPTLRLGYGPFNIFGFYSVTELFKNDRGPGMTPFSIGISFNTL